MDGSFPIALTVHIVGVIFWVGGLFALALVMSAAGDEPATRARIGAIARRAARFTDAAAALAVVSGVTLLVELPSLLRQPWMHIKLTFAVGLLALTGIVRVRAKKLANGGPAPRAMAPIAIALLATAIVAMVIFRPMSR
jgi:protoporphyrinogen IX oxidase